MNMYIIIFKTPSNTFYYKIKDKIYSYKHPVGFKNQYGHEVLFIIPITEDIYKRRHPFYGLRKKLVRKIMKFLEKYKLFIR